MKSHELVPLERVVTEGVGIAWVVFRWLFYLATGALLVTGALEFADPGSRTVFITGYVLFGPLSLIYPFAFPLVDELRKVLRWSWYLLPLDVAGLGLMVYGVAHYGDPLYPLVLGLVLNLAAITQRRWVWLVGMALGGAHAIARIAAGLTIVGVSDSTAADEIVLLLAKASFVALVGYALADFAQRQSEKVTAYERSQRKVESLNIELSHRLSEIHVVGEITEVIHSTLDFETIGPIVLESLRKALDVEACSLMVVDRTKDETVFSSSAGMEGTVGMPSPEGYAGLVDMGGPEDAGSMFTCASVIEHNEMGVIFCCPATRLDALTDDDMLVLQAVGSELVVAVENSQLYQLTKKLSITDELTGLRNYRFLQQRLEQEYERANRYNRYLSLLMIDIDYFKRFNDAHGHYVGDRALAEFAGVLRDCVREVDVVVRYGGEEFSIILPETDAAGAFVVAEKIRESVARFEFVGEDGVRDQRLTVSIGVATFPVHALDKEGLLRQADDALYQAKNFGRNRVRAPRVVSHAS